ncbi:hypothetical protein EJB05_11907, partial [Eragrostis curvula]
MIIVLLCSWQARFLIDIPKLPRCKVLKLYLRALEESKGAFVTNMLHILRGCVEIKKLVIYLTASFDDWHWDENELPSDQVTTNGIILNSLEDIVFSSLKVRNREVAMVRLLLLCCGVVPRRVAVHATHSVASMSRTACYKIAGFCHPETSVEFYRYTSGRYGLM